MTQQLTQYEPAPLAPVVTEDQIDLIKRTVAVGATDAELQLYLYDCQRHGVHPLDKLLHFTKRQGKYTPITSIDLLRSRAADTGELAGIDDAEFTGELATASFAARVTVYRMVQGIRCPYTATARWSEYKPGQDFMWKRMPHTMLAKCFDDQTEVLTDSGFVLFENITTERILQVTPQGLVATDAQPFAQMYNGPMVAYESDDLNFCVTPNHDMMTTFGKVEASAMFSTSHSRGPWRIPRIAPSAVSEAPVTDDTLRLCAYVIADGSDNQHQQYRISVSRPHKVAALAELNMHASRGVQHSKGQVAHTPDRDIRSNFDKAVFGYAKVLVNYLIGDEKIIHRDRILTLSARQAKILVDAWVQFDGHANKKTGVRRVYTSRRDHVKAFELAAVVAGYTVSPRCLRKSDIGLANFSITISDRDAIPIFWRESKPSLNLTMYNGFVWCVTVPGGEIIVRRDGFSMRCGNCAEALALRRAFPRQLAGLYAREEMSQAEAMPARALAPTPAPETVTIEGTTANVKQWYTDQGAGRLAFTLGDTLVIAANDLAETWFDLEGGESLVVEGAWCKHPEKGRYIGAGTILRKPEPAGHVSDSAELPL